MKINEDHLKVGDLKLLVHHIFEIDSYKSKMGDDKDVAVLNFTVNGSDPAKDLVNFIEKGYDFVLDADMTPGEMEDGNYLVFVELERNRHVVEQIIELLYGIGKLAEIEKFKFRYYKSFHSKDAVSDELKSAIPLSAFDYENRVRTNENHYQHFFNKSLMEHIHMNDDYMTFKKPRQNHSIIMKFITSGSTNTVLEAIPNRVSVDYKDMAEVMFLTKYFGNYNITKMNNQFMFENNNHAVILERIS